MAASGCEGIGEGDEAREGGGGGYNPGVSTIIHAAVLPNGLTLLGEPIAGVSSVALTMLLPAGVVHEPADRQGLGAMLGEMIYRGAGERDARAHSDALDRLGVDRGGGVELRHLRLSATMLARHLHEALPLLLDMVRRPHLPEAALEPSRDLALQALDGLEDEPQSKVFIEVRRRHSADPLGRSTLGVREHLSSATLDEVRGFWRRTFVPEGAILGVAGVFQWDRLLGEVERLMGDWSGEAPRMGRSTYSDDRKYVAGSGAGATGWKGDPGPKPPAYGAGGNTNADRLEAASARGERGYQHIHAESAQVHIGLAFDAEPETAPEDAAVLQKLSVAVLSGGMSGRLFTEVREKRGLCYSVGARYGSDKERGVVLCYSGTTPQRAQETLEVLTAELSRLQDGVTADELRRAVVGSKSGLVMQGESTRARSAAIAYDQYLFGRARTLDETAARIDAVTLDRLNAFVRAHPLPPAEDRTVVTVGPGPLVVR